MRWKPFWSADEVEIMREQVGRAKKDVKAAPKKWVFGLYFGRPTLRRPVLPKVFWLLMYALFILLHCLLASAFTITICWPTSAVAKLHNHSSIEPVQLCSLSVTFKFAQVEPPGSASVGKLQNLMGSDSNEWNKDQIVSPVGKATRGQILLSMRWTISELATASIVVCDLWTWRASSSKLALRNGWAGSF